MSNRAAINLSTRTIKIYSSAYDATARAEIEEHLGDTANPHGVTAAQIGLGNADNTSDAAKPISDAQAAAFGLKAPLASPALSGVPTAPTAALGTVSTQLATAAFVQAAINALDVPDVAGDLAAHVANTNNPHAVDKADVGLGNVDNTADVVKPISAAQQAAVNVASAAAAAAQADIDGHQNDVGNPHATTKTQVGLGAVDNTADLAKPVSTAQQAAINVASAAAGAAQADIDGHQAATNNPHSVTKSQVGLGLVDNTTDLAKPVSSAQQAAINVAAAIGTAAQADIDGHQSNTSNPHAVTKAQVGLGLVDNTADLNKPVSTPTQAAINAAVAALTSDDVGLGNVDNTSDAAKPVSDATAAALALKAPLDSAGLTGLPTAPTAPTNDSSNRIATTAFARAAASAAQNPGLAGDAISQYGTATDGETIPPVDPTWATATTAGNAIQVDAATAADPQIIAPLAALAIEPGRSYQLRWRVRREIDPADPLNDSVTLAVRWLRGDKSGISTTTVEDIALTVDMGTQERSAAIGPAGIAGIDYLPPADAVYFRPFVEFYGDSHTTDVLVLETRDTTGTMRVETLADMALVAVSSSAPAMLIQRYDDASLDAPAWYKRVASDPGVPMAAQDATGAWFILAEDPATPEMAGALGDNTGDDAPAFSRLLRSGDRVVKGRVGATYRIAQDGTSRKTMYNDGAVFDAMTLDMTDTTIVLNSDAGVSSYASFLDITGEWNRFTVIGGTWTWSTKSFLYGLVTAKGAGTGPTEYWFEFERAANLPHPAWTDQTVRNIDRFEPDTREFRYRFVGEVNSDVTGSGLKSSPGFPMTQVSPTRYRVDMRDAQLSIGEPPNEVLLPTPADLLARVEVGMLAGLQHRRDTQRGMNFGRPSHNGTSFLTMTDVVMHQNDTVGVRPYAVDGGQITRLRIMPEDDRDLYSTNAGGFRLQDCRGTWALTDCWCIRSGDDGFILVGTTQTIVETPSTVGSTLSSNQLRLSCGQQGAKPMVGDVVQLRDWAAGYVDESDVWTVTAVGPELAPASYLLTLDKPCNPEWKPTGTTVVVLPPDEENPGGEEDIIVGDGVGWLLDTTAAPVVVMTGTFVNQQRGAGVIATHVGAGSYFGIARAIDNSTSAITVGNHYPSHLNGMAPRNVDVDIGLATGGKSYPVIDVGGYRGNTRDLAAAEGYVRDVNIEIGTIRDTPRGFIELRGCTRVDVGVASAINYMMDPNEAVPESLRAVHGDNTAFCKFDGAAIAQLSRWDVIFDGTSHDNIIESPAKAHNFLDNSAYRLVARGASVAMTGTQVATFDRWLAARTSISGAMTVSRQPGFAPNEFCMRVQRNAGNTSVEQMLIGQQLPGPYVRTLRSRSIVAWFRVRGGANISLDALVPGSHLRARIVTGTVFGESWVLNDSATGGLTGGIVTDVDAAPDIVPTPDGAIYNYVTRPFTVPTDAAVLGLRLGWEPQPGTAGAADYLEFGLIALVIAGDGFGIAPPLDDVAILTGQLTTDPASIASGATGTQLVTVVGAVLGDMVEAVSFSLDLQGMAPVGFVSAADTVTIRLRNNAGAAIDLAPGTFRVRVRRAAA